MKAQISILLVLLLVLSSSQLNEYFSSDPEFRENPSITKDTLTYSRARTDLRLKEKNHHSELTNPEVCYPTLPGYINPDISTQQVMVCRTESHYSSPIIFSESVTRYKGFHEQAHYFSNDRDILFVEFRKRRGNLSLGKDFGIGVPPCVSGDY